ncbi:MAG: UDP-N-acetylmuramoyl-tripeptide--D-alanyl-D-alanine ligase [Alphaproteobacteria bacterium]|jgi:UDP-N-acetylmuramoyl-tripeptide--D-alanyl-D-alanine ligase|nr:UDP-N-acetylmuramoyl-tripeptide--D-alanyl-D-alanine ligase [Candidatus Jidaibacter sp.]
MAQVNVNAANTQEILWDSTQLSEALSIAVPSFIEANSVSIDSRKISEGSIFVGIKGENFNGNLFAQDALDRGAILCILDADTPKLQDVKNVIYVDNALAALNQLGVYKRKNFKGEVIAVTGSAGKTTTKEMLRAAIGAHHSVYASFGNFNNNYGLALTLANMPNEIDYAVIELGMNHAGELTELSKIAKPDVSIITNIAPAHLEFFESVEDIARAKAEIFIGTKKGGYAILNKDNQYFTILEAEALKQKLNIISFGESQEADFRLMSYKFGGKHSDITVLHNNTDFSYILHASGKHNAINSCAVLAAISCAQANIDAAVSKGFANFQAQSGRGELILNTTARLKIFDQSYNANPESTKAAIANLGEYRDEKSRLIAILGDMRELGETAQELHLSLLAPILKANIDKVFCVGALMNSLYKKLPDAIKGAHADTSKDMAKMIMQHLKPDDIILVKGSFSMDMQAIVNTLKNCG